MTTHPPPSSALTTSTSASASAFIAAAVAGIIIIVVIVLVRELGYNINDVLRPSYQSRSRSTPTQHPECVATQVTFEVRGVPLWVSSWVSTAGFYSSRSGQTPPERQRN
jgi:hypothetical protein